MAPGNDPVGALVSLQLDGALQATGLSTLGRGSILGRGGDVRLPALRATFLSTCPAFSPPLRGRGGGEGSAAACHLLLQTSVLTAFRADPLSVLPPPPRSLQLLLLPSPPRSSTWVCRLQAEAGAASWPVQAQGSQHILIGTWAPRSEASRELTGGSRLETTQQEQSPHLQSRHR